MAILHLRFSCHLFVFMASDVVLRSQPDTVDSPSTQKVSVPSHTARGQTFNGCVQRKYYGRKNMIWIEVFRYQTHVHHAVFSGTGFLRCRLIINRHVISGLRHWTLCVVCVYVRERERNKEQGGVSPLEQYSRSINQSLTAVKGEPPLSSQCSCKGRWF